MVNCLACKTALLQQEPLIVLKDANVYHLALCVDLDLITVRGARSVLVVINDFHRGPVEAGHVLRRSHETVHLGCVHAHAHLADVAPVGSTRLGGGAEVGVVVDPEYQPDYHANQRNQQCKEHSSGATAYQ